MVNGKGKHFRDLLTVIFKGRVGANRLKMDSNLTPASFNSLLAFLGPDSESAALAYLDVRRALFTFFATRGATDPNELADETINRVARRLSEGVQITTENPSGFFYAVARNVWRESLAKSGVLTPLPEDESALPITSETPHDLIMDARERIESEVRRECLERCLGQLGPEERELVISYHQFRGGAKIENRKALAARLGISNNTLRQKVARLKLKLGECARKCLRS